MPGKENTVLQGGVPYTFLVLSKRLDSRVNKIFPDTYVTSDGILVLSNVACSFLRIHLNLSRVVDRVTIEFSRRYFQHTHFIPIVDVGMRCDY